MCELANVSVEVELRQGASVAAVLTVLELARRLGIIEVFRGNTQDPATVAAQIAKLSQRFGGGEVTLVGDRGMLKSREVKNLTTAGMHTITAITRPQIESLLKRGVLQLGLFDQALAEVTEEDGRRYVLHRNPVQAEVCAAPRADPLATWKGQVAKTNTLDRCYALVTDLTAAQASKELIDARYHDLALVEQAFRTAKTALLEMRPLSVRLESRRRGHALVVMLATMQARSLGDCWRALDATVEEGLQELKELCTAQVWVRGRLAFTAVPQPRESTQALLSAAGIDLPAMLPAARRAGPGANTRRKLPSQRRTRPSRKAAVDTNGSATAKP